MSIRSSVTISLVPEVRGGPFIFWDDLSEGCRQAAELGFDAVEIFAPSADAVDPAELRSFLERHRLRLAAMGTGAGWVRHKWTLIANETEIREKAEAFVRGIIDRAATFQAPAIIGSMQGRWGDGIDRPMALARLSESLNRLGTYAETRGVPLIYEPLNRYETNLLTNIADTKAFLQTLTTRNVVILADLFHMNIEEVDIPSAIRVGGQAIGHVHFVDSNRRPAGLGHLDFASIASALREIGYNGYLSAEAMAYPTPLDAARQTIATFRQHFSC